MKIKSIEITDFKGTRSATYDFQGKSAKVSGKNGVGKTTIADAFFYLFCGRDNELTKNPEIFPIDMEEAKPTVRCTVEIDGVDHVLAKWQVRKKKEKADGTIEVSTVNEFSINEVPKNATTFEQFLNEHGVDTTTFLQFAHPSVFVSQMDNKKERDAMRATLFSMANSYTDLQIAEMTDGTNEVSELLSKYSMDEVRAMYTVQKKKAVENVENIPQQILGLEMAKVNEDVAEWNLQKVDFERQIGELQAQISASDSSVALSNLNAKKAELQNEIRKIELDADMKLQDGKNTLRKAISDLESKAHEQDNRKLILEDKIDSCNKILEQEKENRESYGKRYHEEQSKVFDESAWTFDEKSDICPNCGQRLPEDKIAEIHAKHEENYANAKENFDKSKKIVMQEMIEKGNHSKAISAEAEEKKLILENDLAEVNKILSQYTKQMEELNFKLMECPTSVDLSSNEEIIELRSKIAEIDKEIANLDTTSDNSQIENQIRELKSQIAECDKHIASVANNVRIDEQIANLRNEQQTAEQKKADAERILYQLDEVSKRKNTMLSEDINKHFDLVDFIFFDYQKNGSYLECCLPTVNGKRLGESMNTGLALMAKLDIIRGLQKFYNAEIPVFVDGAECLDNENLGKLPSDIQTIFLKVSDDDLKVEVM